MAILYKYFDFEGFNRFLKNRKLLFSHPTFFNDIFDSKIRDDNPGSKQFRETFVNIGVYILCFTRSYDNALMWAHYGKEHRGVVVGIDIDKISDLSKENCAIPPASGSVIYTKKRPNYDSKNRNNIFLYKSTEWAYEEEVRVVKGFGAFEDKEKLGDRGYLLEIPMEAIKEVYLGARFEDALLPYVEDNKKAYGDGCWYDYYLFPKFHAKIKEIKKQFGDDTTINMFEMTSKSWQLELMKDEAFEDRLKFVNGGVEIIKQGYDQFTSYLTET